MHIASPLYMAQPVSDPGSYLPIPSRSHTPNPHGIPLNLSLYYNCTIIFYHLQATCSISRHSPATNRHTHCLVAAAVNLQPCAPRLRFASPNQVISTEATNTYGLLGSTPLHLQNTLQASRSWTLCQTIPRFFNHFFTQLVPQFHM